MVLDEPPTDSSTAIRRLPPSLGAVHVTADDMKRWVILEANSCCTVGYGGIELVYCMYEPS